ncbi:MAG: TonB family protein [Polyangiales bacterium]
MFCTSCGASNPEDARFCNQCGVALVAEGDGKPPTMSGVGGAPRAPSMQGRGPSLQGGASLDGATVPMNGLPRGRVMGIAAGTGVACLALGAALAYRSPVEPQVVPVTPGGLLGEPAAVVPVLPSAEAPAPRRTGSTGRPAPRPGVAPGNAPGSAGGNPASAGNNAGNSAGNNPGSAGNNGGTTGAAPENTAGNTAGTPSGTGGTAPPPAENGVIERGPRVTRGGFHLGEETDATGTMDPRVFSFVYNQKRAQISACYSSASRSRAVSGVIVLRVRINTQGLVGSTRVISDSVRVPELTQCVQTAVRSWRYPQPEGGDVEVDYPMRFGSSS